MENINQESKMPTENVSFWCTVFEDSYSNRRRRLKELRKILSEEGFKREFWRHPASETYSFDKKTEVVLYNRERLDKGCEEHAIAPYRVGEIGIKGVGELTETLWSKLKDFYNQGPLHGGTHGVISLS